jgi:CubicO group peptidase (beta-lactamase class C family)
MSKGGYSEVVALLEGGLGVAFPSAALYCGHGGHPTLDIAVGAADLDTWFDLASLTKALCTSVLCMRLVEAGRLDLDEPVLPGVSVRALLSHTSGLPAWRPLFLSQDSKRDLTRAPDQASRQEVVRAAAQCEREPAGARTVYSDLGFILLGDFLERRTGERLDVEFSRLLRPLGVKLCFRPLDAPAAAQAVPAERCAKTCREDTEPREPLLGVVHDDNARAMLGVAGHAGLFGTASGVARLAEALLAAYNDDGTVAQRALGISAATVRRFWARPAAPKEQDSGATFGLGWDHPSKEASSAGQLWPRDGVGHLGFTGCSLWLDPPTRTLVVFLTNRVCMPTAAAATAAHAAIKTLRPALHDAILGTYGFSPSV